MLSHLVDGHGYRQAKSRDETGRIQTDTGVRLSIVGTWRGHSALAQGSIQGVAMQDYTVVGFSTPGAVLQMKDIPHSDPYNTT